MTSQTGTTPRSVPNGFARRAANVALSVSAVALMAVVVVFAGRQPAQAAGAAMGELGQSGDYTALTCRSDNQEVLVVLDGRNEQLFVYKVVNQSSVEVFQREDVSRMFADARARARGVRPN